MSFNKKASLPVSLCSHSTKVTIIVQPHQVNRLPWKLTTCQEPTPASANNSAPRTDLWRINISNIGVYTYTYTFIYIIHVYTMHTYNSQMCFCKNQFNICSWKTASQDTEQCGPEIIKQVVAHKLSVPTTILCHAHH